MNADFFDAHNRHFQDAEFLFLNNRLPNADQLYGVSAECGLKAIMKEMGMQVDPNTNSPSSANDRKHINQLWVRFESYRGGYSNGAIFASILPSTNPFSSWTISGRYANTTDFTQAMVEQHKNAAVMVKNLVKKAQLEGLL